MWLVEFVCKNFGQSWNEPSIHVNSGRSYFSGQKLREEKFWEALNKVPQESERKYPVNSWGQLTADGPRSGLYAGALSPLRSGPPGSTASCSDVKLQGCFPQRLRRQKHLFLTGLGTHPTPLHTFSYPTPLICRHCKLFPTNLLCFTQT